MAKTRAGAEGFQGEGEGTGGAPAHHAVSEVPVAASENGLRGEADAAIALPRSGRARPVIEHVAPSVDGGRWPAKRVVGEVVTVTADAFTDGHDQLRCEVRWRPLGQATWSGVPMEPLGNDRFEGHFTVTSVGRHEFSVRAAIDRFASWLAGLSAKVQAGQSVRVDLLVGQQLVAGAARRARGEARARLRAAAERLGAAAAADTGGGEEALGLLADQNLAAHMAEDHEPGAWVTSELRAVEVDRPRAGCSAWYELFPRSASPDPDRPGTLADVARRLGYLSRLGFDVLYLPPVHPIGQTNRKGRDGAPLAGPGDPGSPWAIGSAAGGHTAIDPGLGTVTEFEALVAAAADLGIEVAMDLAFQCSPDHPWVAEHPEWFRHLPDGSIACAENPPKRYEDVYPLDFECEAWQSLWLALRDVVECWIARGVRIFRVDNPHTKSLRFWRWLIAAVNARHRDVLFLAEAFTRPRLMEHLGKIGFHQSYTYFTWRNTKWEIETYLTELTRSELVEYLRPNFWPNTPDILHASLQHGGRAAFMARLVLAATLSANYGIYGPAFELQAHEARHEGSEEYLHSEKYEVRHWNLDDPASLADLVARINGIRRQKRALQQNRTLRFHHVDNEQLLAYSKTPGEGDHPTPEQVGDVVLVVVNLDPYNTQSGWTALDLGALGLPEDRPFIVHDLLTDARYEWRGPWNYVSLDPGIVPAHVLAVGPSAP